MQIFSPEKVNIGALRGAPMSASDCLAFVCLLICLRAFNNLVLQVKKESRRELQCKDDELEDAGAAAGKKVTTLMIIFI